DPPNRARARAHRDLAALELRPELDQQRALLGRELGVKDRSTARAQRGDQAVTTQQARELAQQLERPAASLDPPPWLAKAELEQLAEQRPLALVEHEDAAVGSKLGRILIGEQRGQQPLAALVLDRLAQRQKIAPALATVALEPAKQRQPGDGLQSEPGRFASGPRCGLFGFRPSVGLLAIPARAVEQQPRQ